MMKRKTRNSSGQQKDPQDRKGQNPTRTSDPATRYTSSIMTEY